MRVGAQRNAAACFPCDVQQVNVEVLSVRIAVDLDRFVQPRSFVKDILPLGRESKAKVVNPATRMTKDLDRRIAQRSDVPRRLIFLRAQRGVNTARGFAPW